MRVFFKIIICNCPVEFDMMGLGLCSRNKFLQTLRKAKETKNNLTHFLRGEIITDALKQIGILASNINKFTNRYLKRPSY